jgi:hypothetical protein
MEYLSLMSKTTYTTPTGTTYSYSLERKTRLAFAEFMEPTSAYEEVYYQVNVANPQSPDRRLNFGFVNNPNDITAIQKVIEDIDNWNNTPSEVLASMHSARD